MGTRRTCPLAQTEPHVGLHAQSQLTGRIRNFKDGLSRPCVFVDNRADVDQAAAKFLAGVSRGRKSRLHVFAQPAEIFFEDRRFDPEAVERNYLQNDFPRMDFFSRGFPDIDHGSRNWIRDFVIRS